MAHEDVKSPNRPDGIENNRHLAAYTAAMKYVADELVVIDLTDIPWRSSY